MRRTSTRLKLDEATSRRLGAIRQRGTRAELLVRQLLTDLGLHFRTSNRDLAGSPDLANRSQRWAVFVNGCFWHSHVGCSRATIPKRNRAFWTAKFKANRARDRRVIATLTRQGIRVIVVWECELKDMLKTKRRLQRELIQRAAKRPSYNPAVRSTMRS